MQRESRQVEIPVPEATITGDLIVPDAASASVVFAHGSRSSRSSPRNQAVAAVLRARGLGTLLFDLLTAAEKREDRVTGRYRFDIPLLAGP